MITNASHFSIFVLDQDGAFDFYVNKLGFKVHTDAQLEPGNRWLTVTPPEQPEMQIALMPTDGGMMFPEDAAKKMKEMIKRGIFGFAVFQCNDLLATYEELKAKGVHFKKEPKKEFYGFEALFVDDSGNWFSLTEKDKKK